MHERFGGWVIEEVLEYGSLRVTEPTGPSASLPLTAPASASDTVQMRSHSLEDLERSSPELELRLATAPQDHNARFTLANALVEARRAREAVPLLVVLADSYSRDGFFHQARGFLRRADKLDPGNVEVLSRLEALAGKSLGDPSPEAS